MTSNSTKKRIRIQGIEISNYKGIDHLELSFPAPRSGEPDILVMGSENGMGKTSVLECCALVLQHELRIREPLIDVPDLLIRAGEDKTVIKCGLDRDGQVTQKTLEVGRDGDYLINGEKYPFIPGHQGEADILSTIGYSPNPVLDSDFLFLHSFRKIREVNPELGDMLVPGFQRRSSISSAGAISEFKMRILKSMMSQAGLFEPIAEKENAPTEKLSELLREYVGGEVGKLRPTSYNTIDIRINPLDGSNSFSFDGLSSGQKEIVSTLFLIWDVSRYQPMVILIDEPELHLNSQWHRRLIRQLYKLAPKNQYIIATHSQEIMDSVDSSQRILLTR